LSSAHLTWDGGCQILMGHSKTPAQAMQQTYITLTASGMTHKQSVGHIPNGQGVPTLWRRLPHPQYHSFGAPSFFGRCREESKDTTGSPHGWYLCIVQGSLIQTVPLYNGIPLHYATTARPNPTPRRCQAQQCNIPIAKPHCCAQRWKANTPPRILDFPSGSL
jgi:hypothetical protein